MRKWSSQMSNFSFDLIAPLRKQYYFKLTIHFVVERVLQLEDNPLLSFRSERQTVFLNFIQWSSKFEIIRTEW